MADDVESRLKAREGSVLDGKWTLERLLGSGGMAAVYMARHRNGARGAVKILHPDLARNKEVRERFLREGYAANQVEHAGAVRVLDDDVIADGPDKGTAYLVMELLLDGETLQDRLERGPPMDELKFLRVAESVLEVLDAAHARGVVHRDLKPENLFLLGPPNAATAPKVKILDFGLARLLQNQSITTHGLALGTPSFMSPEQAAGRIADIDGRTDLFALAATGFRLRAGRRIHEADNPVDLVLKMSKVPAPRLATVAPGASAPFARVIDRGLEFKREDRYETAAAMTKDVRLAIKQLEGGMGATRLAKPFGLPPTVPRTATTPKEPSAATVVLSDGDIVMPHRAEWPEDDASIRIPKNRSILPWLLLFVVAGVGGKLWGGKALEVARAKWASSMADAPVAPPAALVQPGGMDASTASQGDAGKDPQVANADRKPAGVTAHSVSTPLAPAATHHHAPTRTSPAQVLKGQTHRP